MKQDLKWDDWLDSAILLPKQQKWWKVSKREEVTGRLWHTPGLIQTCVEDRWQCRQSRWRWSILAGLYSTSTFSPITPSSPFFPGLPYNTNKPITPVLLGSNIRITDLFFHIFSHLWTEVSSVTFVSFKPWIPRNTLEMKTTTQVWQHDLQFVLLEDILTYRSSTATFLTNIPRFSLKDTLKTDWEERQRETVRQSDRHKDSWTFSSLGPSAYSLMPFFPGIPGDPRFP